MTAAVERVGRFRRPFCGCCLVGEVVVTRAQKVVRVREGGEG